MNSSFRCRRAVDNAGAHGYAGIMIPKITDAMIFGATQTEKMVMARRSYWLQGHVDRLQIDAKSESWLQR